MAIGATTVISFIVLFSPFLTSFPTHFIPSIQRIFPFARGLFEDKVANFWCASNVFFKWNKYFPTQHLPKLATALTAIGFIPSMYALLAPSFKAFGALETTSVVVPSQSRSNSSIVAEKEKPAASRPAPTFVLFTHALLQCSFAFFLFSFQVHEKTILVPLLPVMLLMVSSAPGVDGDWEWGVLVGNVACFR
jgi:alpha-1,3-glucosyltransferase